MGASKSRRRARSRSVQKQAPGMETLQRRVQQTASEKVTFTGVTGGIKMSEVIEAFIEPYLDWANTEENLRKLVSIAGLAWNTALFPEEQRAELLDDGFATFPPEARAGLRAFVEELIKRKDQHFSDIRRTVVDFEVRTTKEGFYLSVASSPNEV
ncbi:MAG: hypothetical protein BWY63_00669 [Chloroflexi bacterium ADurb.Bin360]|nr:MAG: hypothetical protein BWY63_00669 [Chloroflexi bacterium ADurb.Bin360]